MLRSRRTLALVVSLAIHLAILSRVATTPPPAKPRARAPSPALTWVDLPAEPPRKPSPPTAPPPAPSRPASRTPPATPAVSRPPATEAPRAEETPRLTSLTPRIDLSRTDDGPAPHGVTLHPGDEPDERSQRADEGARVTERVEGFLKHDLNRAKLANGLVDPEYSELRRRLASATQEVPDLIDVKKPAAVARALTSSWAQGASRYGRTGSAYDAPEGFSDRPTPLDEAVARGSPDAMRAKALFNAGARLQEFADGRAGTEIFALVEIVESATGQLVSLQLAQGSGVKGFDDWVLSSARAVTAEFSLDAGARHRGMRSVWKFTGVVTYHRALKKLGPQDAWYLAAMTALGVMSGRFDEVTGEVDIIDLRNPHYECKVSLLEAE